MGEAKRRRGNLDDVALALTRELSNQGKIIQAGFVAFESYVIPKNAPDIQRREMLLAFMAGAEHVFSSMLAVLDPGDEPTDADMQRMENIQKELDEWRAILSERVQPSQGSA